MSAGRPTPGRSGVAPEVTGEEAELLALDPALGLPRPAYDGRSVCNVARSLLEAALGGAPSGSPPVPPLDRDLDPFRGRRSEGPIVQFLVDGLGWYAFRAWAERADRARSERWRLRARPITTVFPSTTTTALYSLSTATTPGQHGLVGYRQYLPRYGVVADMLKMSPTGVSTPDLLVGPDWSPAALEAPPTIFRRGVRAVALTRDRFHGTGFTRLLYDGAEFVGYATATDLAAELLRLLAEDTPSAIFVYWDELDTIQHLKGPTQDLFDFELDRIAHLLEHVAARLPPSRAARTTLIVTGDHGQVTASESARIAIDREPTICREMLLPLAGDRRAGFFKARPGRLAALEEALTERLPDGARVIGVDRALEHGLFGPAPYHPEVRERIGDLITLVPSPSCLTYVPPGMAGGKRWLLGAHGGLEPLELLVPLIGGPLDGFAAPPEASRQQR